MKQLLFISISFFFLVIFFGNCGVIKKNTLNESYLENNILSTYGQEVYMREGCYSCHTLQIEKASSKLISLDGLGGKYSNSWLYFYLSNPTSVIPQSIKPAYTYLYTQSFDKSILSKIKSTEQIKTSEDELWNNLLNESEILSKEFKNEGLTSDNKEILALISYLQQIPKSNKKTKLDSIEHSKKRNEEKIWLDSISTILQNSNNEEAIANGKLLFQKNCSPCHGQHGEGLIGPNLTDNYWLHSGKKLDIARTIIYGVPEKGMVSWKNILTVNQISELASYVSSIKGSNPKNPKEPQGEKE